MIKEAKLYETLSEGRVRCTACARYCNIPEGKIGLCGIRQNLNGRLHLLVYGKVITGHIDPIEKKPVTHFMPGTKIFSIATTGCNWLCHYCQNYDISQRRKVEGVDVTPEEVVRLTQQYRCEGIAYTYNQPTIFIEFARDVGVLARKAGIINAFVSNGYDTPETVKMMNEFLDAITVDFKGNGETNFLRRYVGVPNAEPIFQTLLEIKKKTKIHVEITDLVVPEVGDDVEAARKLAEWVHDNLGPETPIHFLRFHPDYKLMHLGWTPIETLEKHHAVAKEVGLQYVYLGNIPGHPLEHTYCPECGKIVVRRAGFDITGWHMDENNCCKHCGHPISIKGRLSRSVIDNRFVPVIN
ncbi:MAG: AmmeMemoRadiSam system radical SAM enzyme [Candidatus Bathyarchaeia archaeon]